MSLGVDKLTTTAYHQQVNGKANGFNRTIITSLSLYVPEHQMDWDHFVQPFTYTFHTQKNRSTRLPPSAWG